MENINLLFIKCIFFNMFKYTTSPPVLKIARKMVKRTPIELAVIRKNITDPCVQPKISRKSAAGRMSINSFIES